MSKLGMLRSTRVDLLVRGLQEYQRCRSHQPGERVIHNEHREDHLARKGRVVWLDTWRRRGDQQSFCNQLSQLALKGVPLIKLCYGRFDVRLERCSFVVDKRRIHQRTRYSIGDLKSCASVE